jgi:hypothetical protein
MAARIQAKINAPCKEDKCVPSVTVEHVLPERTSQPPIQQPKVAAGPKADSNRSRSRARSYSNENDSDDFSFTSFMHTGSEADLPRARNNRSKRRRIDTTPPQQDLEVTSTVGANLPSDITTNITIPDNTNNDNHNNIDVDEGDLSQLSGADKLKQKLRRDLTRFLNNELSYAGILIEVLPPTRELYKNSPHRKPYSDLDFEFNRALNHWERLIKKLTASSDVTPSHLDDPLQDLAAQTTFTGRVAKFNDLGPTWHIDFPLERWTISLALFFEFLLGEAYMPLSFESLVNQLRTANQSLYETIRCGV